jgi:amidase
MSIAAEGAEMDLSEYVDHDAVGLAELTARGEVRPEELAAAAAAAVEAVNPEINAVVETWPAEHAAADGPLRGVPFLVKDIGVAVAGRRSELGSRLAAGHVSRSDSALVRRFRAAGLAVLGRTTTPELAAATTTESVLHGITRNPWSLDRSSGGSSGGAAAAVAAGIVPVAHATDAAGSIRVPAAYCGLFGLKPSRGRVSDAPAGEVLHGLAVQLGVSRTVRDSAVLLDLVAGHEPGDPYRVAPPARPYVDEVRRDPGSLRIAVMEQAWGGTRTIPAVADAVGRTAELLERLGHRVAAEPAPLGADWARFVEANTTLWTANIAAQIESLAAATGRPIDSSTLEAPALLCHAFGRMVTGPQVARALAVRDRVARSLGAWFCEHDVLLTPTVPELPLPVGAHGDGVDRLDGHGWIDRLLDRSPFTVAFNVAGTPAMSVPLERDTASGLPIGLQFAAGYGREDVLFRLAGQLERARPWNSSTPAVWAGDRSPSTHDDAHRRWDQASPNSRIFR